MRPILLTALSVLFVSTLSLSVMADSSHDTFWEGFNQGCVGRDIVLDVTWLEYPLNLESASIAFAKNPDSGLGPSFLARINSEISVESAATNPAKVFLAWSNDEKTCIIKTDTQQCPMAKKALKLFSELKLPVGLGFDSPKERFTILHWTEYWMAVKDGNGVENLWNDRSGGGPLTDAVESATQMLLSCSEPARKLVAPSISRD